MFNIEGFVSGLISKVLYYIGVFWGWFTGRTESFLTSKFSWLTPFGVSLIMTMIFCLAGAWLIRKKGETVVRFAGGVFYVITFLIAILLVVIVVFPLVGSLV